eukprot:978777-Pleurochrysis_carterae.AAC.1
MPWHKASCSSRDERTWQRCRATHASESFREADARSSIFELCPSVSVRANAATGSEISAFSRVPSRVLVSRRRYAQRASLHARSSGAPAELVVTRTSVSASVLAIASPPSSPFVPASSAHALCVAAAAWPSSSNASQRAQTVALTSQCSRCVTQSSGSCRSGCASNSTHATPRALTSACSRLDTSRPPTITTTSGVIDFAKPPTERRRSYNGTTWSLPVTLGDTTPSSPMPSLSLKARTPELMSGSNGQFRQRESETAARRSASERSAPATTKPWRASFKRFVISETASVHGHAGAGPKSRLPELAAAQAAMLQPRAPGAL